MWDEEKTKEIFEQKAQNKLPILKEINTKAIGKGSEQSTNILIEGDNYHVLSVLNYTHKGKIDIIYIDPPYNTGADSFRYNDKIIDREDAYRHSKWLSFMNKRLKLAKRLLAREGIIFISIDDNEIANLKLLCNEIFGDKNFISEIIWKNKFGSGAMNKGFISLHEYILCYARDIESIKTIEIPYSEKSKKMYNKKDEKFEERGYYGTWPLETSSMDDRPNLRFPITYRGEKIWPKKQWLWSKNRIQNAIDNNELIFKKNDNQWSVRFKGYILDEHGIMRKGKPLSIIDGFYTQEGTKDLKNLFHGKTVYPFPKPVNLIKHLINIYINKKKSTNLTILDFFAGSGTTGHAVLELNKVDNGNRKFILCTNNENNICTDVCYPRIKKVIKGYTNPKGEKIKGLGGNLRYFKTDFIDSSSTDQNKKRIVEKSTEMLCLKEGCFELLYEKKRFKIFKGHDNKYLGIVYYYDGIEPFKKQIKKLGKKINTYVFVLSEGVDDDDFSNVKELIDLKPIPSVILNVYRRIFAHV